MYGNEFEVFDLQLKDEDLSYIDTFNENVRAADGSYDATVTS